MSSKMAATRAMFELFGMITKTTDGDKIVFRSYGQMNFASLTRAGYQKRLRRFENHGLLKKKVTSQGHVFEITPKARMLRSKAIVKKNRTDGLSTLIIFDIPEEKHNARDTFRRYLIRNGYTQIRESCFLSPFQITVDMKDLIDE